MASQLQLKFDPNQPHQLTAVDAVVDLFDGLPRRVAEFSLGEEIVANLPEFEDLAKAWLYNNLLDVQSAQGLETSHTLEMDTGPGLEGIADENHSYPNFTVEMETGTGKTYVYLRTIHELRRRYGFSKFIVVVPSIAIFEGVIKNFQITGDHFRALYGNETVNLVPYDGAQLSRLRNFAASTFTEILVMTLDSFNKATNIIYKPSEKLPGELRPFQYIQATRPILILDEPQNMESARAKEALRTLKPLLALRYSATHRSSPNPVCRLTPFEAYRRNLVKRIQVYGITEREDVNVPFLSLQDISTGRGFRATVRTLTTGLFGTREESVTLKQGDDLYAKTGRPEHRGGFVVDEINAAQGFVRFVNGETLWLHAASAPARPEIFRQQIRQTLQQHMELQARLWAHDIKVLSLFFIDRVANYTASDGLIRRLFDEEYERLRPSYPFFKKLGASQVRNGYFARKKTKDGQEEAIDTESRTVAERAAEKRTFELIMRDKERLLSFGEPVCFVFAHSALKEGWDNPNVFQICTLNQTRSEIKKRQEIGRGLRLCVNQQGERVFDEEINVLTVVANESYRSYAANLQREYTEAGDAPPPLPTDARRQVAHRNDDIYFKSEAFHAFWRRLGRLVRYRIHVDSDALVEECVIRLNRQTFPRPVIVIEKGQIVMASFKIKIESVSGSKAEITLQLFDEWGNPQKITAFYKPGDNIARVRKDDRLRALGTVAIQQEGGAYKVAFTNTSVALEAGMEYEYTPEAGTRVRERFVQAPAARHPVFNLLERAARQTGLTRPTINRIFKHMRPDKKRALLDNPEGFASVFIAELRNALADHVTERIEFVVEEGEAGYDLGELFPPTKRYPQKEVVEAGDHGLYDIVQKDSEVEQHYVEAIKAEKDAILFYFKFPSDFKVKLPDLIGNYVPDWGVARVHHNGDVQVQPFVHETKGSTDVQKLQFPHEKRKIRCAEKYFAAIGVNYLTIDPQHIGGWWEMPQQRPQQLGF
jgi:type III restriction enzyme